MPPRFVVVAVVVAWAAAVAWLAAEKWRPRHRDEPPPLVVDLADEVAPQQATWFLYRGDNRIGSAETRMAPRKDGRFDLVTRLRDLELESGPVRIHVPVFFVTRSVTRTGDLVALEARASVQEYRAGAQAQVDATLKGRPHGDLFQLSFDPGSGRAVQQLAPVPLVNRAAFSAYLPLTKYPPLQPGQTWRTANIDPVGEILCAVRPFLGGGVAAVAPLPDHRPPAELAARVADETEEVITPRGHRRACRVIVLRGDGLTARVWVDVADGKVMRQEADGLGETIALVRD